MNKTIKLATPVTNAINDLNRDRRAEAWNTARTLLNCIVEYQKRIAQMRDAIAEQEEQIEVAKKALREMEEPEEFDANSLK